MISICQKLAQKYNKLANTNFIMNLDYLEKFNHINLPKIFKENSFNYQLNSSNNLLFKNTHLVVDKEINENKEMLNKKIEMLFDNSINIMQNSKKQQLQALKQNLLEFKNLPYNVKLNNLQLLDNNFNRSLINENNIDGAYKTLLTKTINEVLNQHNDKLKNLTNLKQSPLTENKLFKACQIASNNKDLDLAKLLINLIKKQNLENNYSNFLKNQMDDNEIHKNLLNMEQGGQTIIKDGLNNQNLQQKLNNISQNCQFMKINQFQNYNSLQHNSTNNLKF